jgi:hypothetical protein
VDRIPTIPEVKKNPASSQKEIAMRKYSIAIPAAIFSLAVMPLAAQTSVAAKPATTNGHAQAKPYTPPKTPWGDPDLQGQWPAYANIPMQRPITAEEKASLSPEELAKRQEAYRRQQETDNEEFAGDNKTTTINPPGYWVEHGKPNAQASLVIDPPSGRIPPLTPAGEERRKELRGGLGPGQHFPKLVNSWEDFDMYSRCITRGMLSSMLPTLYNFGNQIVQARGYVVIRSEMIHESRIIPLDGRPHPGPGIRTYMGDSRGHWEGNTLVVETTNFNGKVFIGGSGPTTDQLKITERFTRTSPTDLVYEATISDPGTWTRPWTIHMPYKLDPSYAIYEYACHEGNYMMLNALKGAREREKSGLDTTVSSDNFTRKVDESKGQK